MTNLNRFMMAIFAIIFLAACGKPAPVADSQTHYTPVVERHVPPEPLVPTARSEHDRMVCVLKDLKKDFPRMTLKHQLRAARHLHYGHGQTMSVDGKPWVITRGDTYYGRCAGPTTEQLTTAITANRDYWRNLANQRGINLAVANQRGHEVQVVNDKQGRQITHLKADLGGAHLWDWLWALGFAAAAITASFVFLRLRDWRQHSFKIEKDRNEWRKLATDHGLVREEAPVAPAAK